MMETKPLSKTQKRHDGGFGPHIVRGALLLIVVGVCAWAIPRHPIYEEWRYARMALPELERERDGRMENPRLLYHIGRRLNAAQRFAEADPYLRQAVGLDPDDPRAREEWTRALLGSGLVKAAFGNLREFAGTRPNDADAHILLGKFYITQRSMARAVEELERAIQIRADSDEAWAHLAGARESLGERQAALRAAERAVALNGNRASHRLQLAGLLSLSNRNAEARREFTKTLELAPNHPSAQREFAVFLLNNAAGAADLQLSARAAESAIQADANDADAHLTLGRARLRLRQANEAIAPLERAAILQPDLPAAPLTLVQAHIAARHPSEAAHWRAIAAARQRDADEERAVGQAMRVRPSDTSLHRRMAKLRARKGDVETVVRRHSSVLRAAPDSARVLIAAANDLSEANHGDKALPLARRAILIGPANPYAHEALGNALLGVGQARQAAVSYQKAANWMPENTPAYKKKLEAFFQKQTRANTPARAAFLRARQLENQQFGPKRITPEIETLAARAVALEGDNVEYLGYLLKVQMERRQNAEAERTARRILALAPEDGRAHVRLALLLVDKAATEAQFTAVESHLDAARYDSSTDGTATYVKGVLALRRGDGKLAVRHLREAVRYDPNTDVTYYKLMLAETMQGNKAEAVRARATFQQMQRYKFEESEVLGNIALKRNEADQYRRAIRYYESRKLFEQANAIRAEAVRRFGAKAMITR